MTYISALADINARFVWTRDKRKADSWRIMREDGPLRGDCEDYALTLLWLACDRSTLSVVKALWWREARIWTGNAPSGEGHALLEVGGRFVDNIQRRFVNRSDLESMGYSLKRARRFPVARLALFGAIRMMKG